MQIYLDNNPDFAAVNDFIPPIREQLARYLFLKNPDDPINSKLDLEKPVTIPFYMLILYGFIPQELLKLIPSQAIMKDPNFIFTIANRTAPLVVQIASRPRARGAIRAMKGVLRLPGLNLVAVEEAALKAAVFKNSFEMVGLLLNAGARPTDQLLAEAQHLVDMRRLHPETLDLLLVFAQQERPTTQPKRKPVIIQYQGPYEASEPHAAESVTTSRTAAAAAAYDKSSKDSKHLKK